MNPKRKQRLVIVLGALAAVALATGLMMYAMEENINLFYTPSQVVAGEAPLEKRIRVGGLVVVGSLQRGDGLSVTFDITDNAQTMRVRYSGILPDLFREGQGIIANGRLVEQNLVEAEEVLAKHDENYMPPEVKHAIEQAGHPKKTE
ncbi:MAG: cytochrome c maturation protein CcmE [Gammaproteobacteria bacterium]|nr:cytochrome c maturation protein CcmE [Gammaproteobacteria bacterium]